MLLKDIIPLFGVGTVVITTTFFTDETQVLYEGDANRFSMLTGEYVCLVPERFLNKEVTYIGLYDDEDSDEKETFYDDDGCAREVHDYKIGIHLKWRD